MSFFSMPLVSGSIVCAKDDDGNLAPKIERLRRALDDADAVIVGAGAGMSTAAGLAYSGARFDEHFADFRDAFGITDMYSGGFYPFPDMETFWAWWSRHIYCNRYDVEPGKPYLDLVHIGGRGLACGGSLRRVLPQARGHERPALGTGRWHEHTRDHQVSVLERGG